MNSKELFHFTGKCLNINDFPEHTKSIRDRFSSGAVDLDTLIILCDKHLVLPLLYLRLKSFNLLDYFPKDYADHLEAIYTLNKTRNEQILLQTEGINKVLAGENIQPVYLKGTAHVLDKLYIDAGERMIGDIDVLVQDKDYLKAAELIQGIGYINQWTLYDDVRKMKHYPRLYHEHYPADIEIHRVPVNIRYSRQFNSEILFTGKKVIPEVSNCFVPSHRHQLIHNFIHSQLSNKGYRYRQAVLRDLYDCYLLSKKVDVRAVVSEVEKRDKARVYFQLAQRVFSFEGGTLKEGSRFSEGGKKVPCWIKQHNRFLAHPRLHRLFINLQRYLHLILVRYIMQALLIPFSKSSRDHIFNRLKDRNWYKEHRKAIKGKQF